MIDTDDDIDTDALGADAWLDGNSSDMLAEVLLDMADAWGKLGVDDGPLRTALQAQAEAWLVSHHARLSPAASWMVLTKVFGTEGLSKALLDQPGCPLAALLAQASALFAQPPSVWTLGAPILDLDDAQRATLLARGFPLAQMCTNPRAVTRVLDLVLTTEHGWILDLWRTAYRRKNPVFTYWTAKKGLVLPNAPLSAQGVALVEEAIGLMCAGKDTQAVRRMAFEYPFDARVWAAGVAMSTAQGQPPIFKLKGSPGTSGLVTQHLGWLFDPNPTAHQVLERTRRLANALPVATILRMDASRGRFDLAQVFPNPSP